MSEPSRWQRGWPHVRALLILLHMAAVLTMCAPARHKVMDARGWNAPDTIEAIEGWAERLSSIGIDTSPDGLRAFLHARAATYASFHDFISRPARYYTDRLDLGQGWSLFSSPKRAPAILYVDIHDRGGSWRPLYRPRSDEHSWRRPMFENNRIRKLVGRFSRHRNSVGLYVQFGNWLARLAAAEFADADMVRTRLWRYKTNSPGVEFDPSVGTLTNERVLSLEILR